MPAVKDTFAEAIEEIQRAPAPPGAAGLDSASPFPMPLPAGHRVADGDAEGRIPGAVAHPTYAHHSRIFNLCDVSESAAYDAIITDCLNGKGALRPEVSSFTKDGDFLVAVRWYTYTAPPADEKDDEDENEEGPR